MGTSPYADPQLCYLDVAATSPDENTILRGGVVTCNIVDSYVFTSVDALLAHIDTFPAYKVGRLIVEWAVEREEHQRAPNRLTSRRVIGRAAIVDGKLVVVPV